MRDTPIEKTLVLLGGGHAHVHVLKSFGMRPMPGVRLTLVSRDIVTPYSGMLPGFIAGHYSREACHIDLLPLARFADARLIQDEAIGIDRAQRRIILKARPPIPYDCLSIDIGSTPNLAAVPGAAAYATAVKPIDRLAARWNAVLERVERSKGRLRFVVVGGGAAGVEIVLAAQHRLHGMARACGTDHPQFEFSLLTRGVILPTHNARVRQHFRSILQQRGIALSEHFPVLEVEQGAVVCADGRRLGYDELLWITDAGPASWLTSTGLALDARGFIDINDFLQSTNTSEVFAAGDCATSRIDPRPKAGVFAVRQGPPLAENLRRALTGSPLKPFKPQSKFLSLISTGDKAAVASRGAMVRRGKEMWTLKDWIDRRWMEGYQRLRPMTASPPEAGGADASGVSSLGSLSMRCGGCGAKIGASALSRVLTRLSPKPSPLAVVGISDADDAAIITPPAGKHLVLTVDFFRAFIDDPYVFGKVAAAHALSDVYAMGGEPLTALATVTVPFAREAVVEEEMFQLLRGALDVLEPDGCALVGGHSAEGAELALGFTINGAVDPAQISRKGGIRPGDALILTKPLGTGILFAADMRGLAKAPWVAGALAVMQVTNRLAADVARSADVHACTDVTGFGLIGHLHEMLRASCVDATINLDSLPLLDGITELVAEGVESTLAPENRRLRQAIGNLEQAQLHPRFPIVFDPQTSGGLLLALPSEVAASCLENLRTAKFCDAAIIGVATAQSGPEPAIHLI